MKLFWPVIFALTLTSCSAGYVSPESIKDSKVVVSSTGDGVVTSRLRSPGGYEWILSEEGLFVHDGSNYIHFKNTSDPESISSTTVNDIMLDSEGRVWAATQKGVDLYTGDSFRHFPIDDANHYMRGVSQTPDGSIWAISRYFLFRLEPADSVFRRVAPLKVSQATIQMRSDDDGSIWINYRDEVVRLALDGSLPEFSVAAGNNIQSFFVDRSALLYLNDGGRLRIVDSRSGKEMTVSRSLQEMNTAPIVNIDGYDGYNVHITTTEGEYVYDSFFNRLTSPEEDNIQSVYNPLLRYIEQTGYTRSVQNGNYVWILSPGSRLAQFGIAENRILAVYDLNAITGRSGSFTDIKCFRDGRLVVCGSAVFILSVSDSGSVGLESAISCPQGRRASIALGADGSIWAGCPGARIYRAEPGGQFREVESGLPDVSVDCWRSVTLHDGTIVFGYSDLGPVFVNPASGEISTVELPDDVKQLFITDLFEDSRGYLVISTSDNGLLVLDPSRKMMPIPEVLRNEYVISVTEGPDGVMFINTLSGAFQCKDRVYSLLWNDADEFPKQKHMLRTPDGQVFIKASDRFMSLSSLSAEKGSRLNYPLSMIVSSRRRVVMHTTSLDDPQGNVIRFSSIPEGVNIYVSCLDYSRRRALSYSYRIGRKGEWMTTMGTTVIPLYNIHYGSNRVELKAADMSSMSETEPLSLNIIVRRPLLHYLLVIFIIAIIITSLVLYYTSIQKKREAELNKAEKEMLERVNRDNIDFFGNISHEFRTPLTLIHGAVDMMKENGGKGSEQARLINVVNSNTFRMLKLVSQMLDFNKLDHDTLRLSVEKTDIKSLVERIVEQFSAGARKKSLDMSFVCEQEAVEGWIDTDKVEKILYNLLSNALKYTPPAGCVEVRLREEGGSLVITVSDTGIGIPENKLEEIFERFTRVEEGRKISSGSGIGLNYTRSLARLHHGTVTAANASPRGAVFTVTLPCVENAYTDSEKGAASPDENMLRGDDMPLIGEYYTVPEDNQGEKGRSRMLIIDDDYEMVHFLKMLFERDYEVDFRYDAVSGYSQMEKTSPDIVICDVMMVDLDGYSFCRMVKENNATSHIPVVLLTARATTRDQIDGYNAGADAYVVKPFDNEYLRTVVGSVIANRKRIQSILQQSTVLPSAKISGTSQNDRDLLEKVYQLMEESLSAQELDVDTISSKLGYSRTKLFYKIKALTGQTPNEFFTIYRLNRSLELLKTGKYKIAAIAGMVGFNSASHFSSLFKKHFGVLPSQIKDLSLIHI